MTERLTRLERRGLIRRTHSQRDRRSVTVQLTEDGGTLIDSAPEDLLAAEARLLKALTESNRRILARLLAKLAASLDAEE